MKSQVGAGTTFEFTFIAGVTGQQAPEKVEISPLDCEGMQVLVAEDNRINQMVIQRILQRLGCQVDVVDKGTEAVQAVRAKHYDLVLMDLLMPEVDGLEAARQIRRQPAPASAVPIVALTASASSEVKAQCLAAGMDGFLSKPIDPQALRQSLERYRITRVSQG